MTALPALVQAQDLRINFGAVKAVDGISFAVNQGETFGVIGESGSGKSTLGRSLVGLLKPSQGHIWHEGINPFALSLKDFRAHRRDYQIVFQDPHAALNPRLTILDSVREPLDILAEGTQRKRNECSIAILDRVGLSSTFAGRYPHELSGGQKQRVNIARALTVRPRLLVCDEVVAALDISIQADVLNLLAQLQSEFGLTYVFITHDLGVVSHVSDRIAVMYLGVIVELGPTESLRKKPWHPYTEALMSAEPTPLPAALRKRERIILQGEIPSPVAPPSGCRFRTRCRYAQSICAEQVPDFREVGTGHWTACHFTDTLELNRHVQDLQLDQANLNKGEST